ncbi:arf-GAP domain and FG repeat-containing protein 1-like isoform X1 [Branchiostoma lanceolatum]|uniref:arf-GAP domain and FG repeat-containing protein 1-like isoform X1 n=1 Tax=Branchiostoma lanceolatum TaxID=7740 RepID=UPI003454EC69
MASRRKQEEKNLKQIRELAALPYNKKCFDCDQKGPTYVNTTIGSFVCTSCSGILRGINPPHRVKSISMTTFTQQEIEFLQKHGNEYCRKVWLGLYDSRSQGMPESRDEQRVKDFMINKYEKRRWYVSPSEIPPPTPPSSASSASTPETKPLKTLLGENTPNLVVQNSVQSSPAISRPQSSQSTSALAPATRGSPAQQKKSATMDLLGDLGGDPFATAAPPPVHVQQTLIPGMGTAVPPAVGGPGGVNGGFANFDQAFSSASAPGFAPQPNAGGLPPTMSSGSSVGSGDFGAFTSSNPAAASSGPPQGSTGSDKYAALADLFSTDSSNQTSLGSGSPNFGATFSGQPEGLQAASRPSSNPYNLDWGSGGGPAGQSTLGGSSSTGMSWGQTASTTSSMARTGTAQGAANPFLSSAAPSSATPAAATNPFFGGSMGGQPNGTFGAQPQANMGGGFSQQAGSVAGSSFASFGGVPTSSAGFGVPLSQTGFGGSQAGFGAATSTAPPSYNAAVYGGVGLQQGAQPVSNGGWGNFSQGGGVPAQQQQAQMAYGGQQQMNPYGGAGFGGTGMPGGPQGGAMPQGGAYTQQQQQQQFTGWGQKQAAGNPFMGAAPQANPSNPFL